MRFLVTLFLGLFILSLMRPWLARIGIGRLPGDIQFRLGKQQLSLPLTSSVVLSVLIWGLARLF